MKLSQLIDCPYDIEINGLSADSREIKPGWLFGSLNGSAYIASAIANGAVAVIAPDDFNEDLSVPVVKAANPN